MSYLRGSLNTSGEVCDKCSKPMTEDEPGIDLDSYTQEGGKARIWAHIECLQKLLFKVRKEHIGQVAKIFSGAK